MGEYLPVIGMLVILIPFYYFLLIRPANKRKKEAKDMRDNLKPGDNVVTIGGFLGKVVAVKDEVVVIECGADKTSLRLLRSAIGTREDGSAGA